MPTLSCQKPIEPRIKNKKASWHPRFFFFFSSVLHLTNDKRLKWKKYFLPKNDLSIIHKKCYTIIERNIRWFASINFKISFEQQTTGVCLPHCYKLFDCSSRDACFHLYSQKKLPLWIDQRYLSADYTNQGSSVPY